ncbi:MAG: prolyl oligopeptidase family serine peptidase [Victivallaceae bacterium]
MSDNFKEIEVISSLDGSSEKNLLYYPENGKNVPLAVVLHTWSFDRNNQRAVEIFCRERGWALLLPEFRGPNLPTNPRATQACGSKLARQDVIDAVEFVCANYSIDRGNIFLAGGSGGGHMALMMAAYRPQFWRGVCAWCPITDLALWHNSYVKGTGYAVHVEACCGGAPGESAEINQEYIERSPVSYLNELMNANLYIRHGRGDSVVPYIHTLNLALKLEEMRHKKLFFEIFDGGHEARHDLSFRWFDALYNAVETQKLTG